MKATIDAKVKFKPITITLTTWEEAQVIGQFLDNWDPDAISIKSSSGTEELTREQEFELVESMSHTYEIAYDLAVADMD